MIMQSNEATDNEFIDDMVSEEENLENFDLKNYIRKGTSTNFSIKDEQEKHLENKLIKNVNNQVLIQILSPQVEKNEEVKREHKAVLLRILGCFLIFQFCAVCFFINKVLNYSILDNSNVTIIKMLLTFISGYITSVVVELIFIIKYIVKKVFDTSIAELVKLFKDNYTPEDKNTDK